MSVHNFVFVRDGRLPSLQEWQDSLDRASSGIVLEAVDDLRVHSGYLPARYHGRDSGFEWNYGPVADLFHSKPEVIGDLTHVADFVTHSDMQELICAMIAGAVLARLSGGLVFDEESDRFIDGEEALVIAKNAEAAHL